MSAISDIRVEQDGRDLTIEDVEPSRVGHLDPGIGGDGMGEEEILEAVEGPAG